MIDQADIMNEIAGNKPERLYFLDSLRGAAALYVLIYHTFASPQPNLYLNSSVKQWIDFGHTGVTLFFIISAFSLCMTMPRHIATGLPLTSFTLSRLFRIVPMFYLLIVVQLIHFWFAYNFIPTPAMIFSSLTFTSNFHADLAGTVVWGGWTVPLEMSFYVIFPFLYSKINSIGKKCLLISASVLFYYYMNILFSGMRYNDLALYKYFPSFIMGMIAFELFSRHGKLPDSGNIILSLGLLLIFSTILQPTGFGIIKPFHIYFIGYTLIVLGFSLMNPSTLNFKFLTFFGKISFSLYLWHLQVINIFSPLLRTIYELNISEFLKPLLCVSFVLSITTLLSLLTYKLVERPFELKGRRLFARLKDNHTAKHKIAFS